MAHARKSLDGRKRARTMEYIDSQVDINDEEPSESNSVHIGQHIEGQFDISMPFITGRTSSESPFSSLIPSISKLKKLDHERSYFQRQMSDITLNRSITNSTKTTTELKGRDHILRLMKTNPPKPTMELKSHRFVQEMIARRHEKQEASRSISDFALKYGLMDEHGKKSNSRKTSEHMTNMAQQLEHLKPMLTKRQLIDAESPVLRIVKLESICNQLLCYCQYVTDQEDLVLFLDPNNEQAKHLAVNDEIRIAGESRLDMNLPDMGSIVLGITDVRKESVTTNKANDERVDRIHRYDFNCSGQKCIDDNSVNRAFAPTFDLLSTFSSHTDGQEQHQSIEPVYDSFTLALMTKRKFDLYATIIIYQVHPINHLYTFLVRDRIGNCLQITFDSIDELPIEIQTKSYIFHQIEYIERISSPKECHRWPYEHYQPPTKLFCFRSIDNRVTVL